MTAKEYLKQIRELNSVIKNKESELFMLECLATGTTAPMDKEAVQTSGVNDKVGTLAVKIVMLKNEILKEKAEALEKISECVSVINSVRALNVKTAEIQYNILHARYVSGKKLKKIAEEEKYNYDYVRELHCAALMNVKKILTERGIL